MRRRARRIEARLGRVEQEVEAIRRVIPARQATAGLANRECLLGFVHYVGQTRCNVCGKVDPTHKEWP